MEKEEVKKFLLNKMTQQWIEDNPDLIKDIDNLVGEFMLFNTKWGTKLQPADFMKEFNK